MKIPYVDQIDPGKLLDRSYIFEVTPESNSSYLYLALLYGLLIILAVVLGLLSKKKIIPIKKLYRGIQNLFLYTGIIGLILIFFRWQGLPYLGSRLMVILLGLFFIVWLLLIILYRFFTLPKIIIEIQERENFEKYLPQKK
jgi:uncharacterized membrane protein YdcZ (DUF606 family)